MVASRNFRSTDPLLTAVSDSLSRHVRVEDRLAVGLSGGVDSVVLLHAMRAHRRDIAAIHVHHGLSDFADRWLEFCHRLCVEWSVPLTVEFVNVDHRSGDGLEAAARRVRHEAFRRLPTDWLALAHHQGDRAETLMLNLLRGAGVRGAGAMRERSGRLIRPLLRLARSDILAYARREGLEWVEDESNTDTRLSRNFLRHCIIPEARKRFPAVERRLATAAARFAEAGDLLDELARIDLGGAVTDFPIAVDLVRGLSEARARNVLRFLLSTKGVNIPSEERLAEALRQCVTARPDRHPAVEFGVWSLRRRGRQIFLELT